MRNLTKYLAIIITLLTTNSYAFNLSNTDKETMDYIKVKANEKIRVAIIDTGIDYYNDFLSDKIFIYNGKKNYLNYGVDFSAEKATTITRQPKDTHGHGTHIAGIIAGVNPNVEILVLKYYNPRGTGVENLKASLKAFNYAISLGVDIINYSGGGPEYYFEEKKLFKKAQEAGILIISAAGNEGENIDNKRTAYYPASYQYDNIISVGAINSEFELNTTSNWGTKNVDIVAPGYQIKSTGINNSIAKMTGTSQATAFVTGVASLIKANYDVKNYKEIKHILLNNCKKLPSLKNKIKNGCSLNMRNIFTNRELASKKRFKQNKKMF